MCKPNYSKSHSFTIYRAIKSITPIYNIAFFSNSHKPLKPKHMEITNNLSEVSINYTPRVKPSLLPKISTSQEALTCFRSIWSNKISYLEEAYILLLSRANKVLGFSQLSLGGTAGTIVDIKVIFQIALKANAHAIVLAHNHPSGNLKPSEADVKITKEIKKSGKFLGIQLLDHLILTEEGFYSFADEGFQ